MEKYLKLFTLVFFVFFAILNGCSQDNGSPCSDPIKEWPFPSTASRWLFNPIKPGDSIKFKVYHRYNRASPYIYRKDEIFFIEDTMVKKLKQTNIFTAGNCNSQMIGDYLTADIAGPESLTIQLGDGAYTELIINLQKKTFGVYDLQYKAHQVNWDDTLIVEGEKYNQVKNFQGSDNGSNYYIDSTYCFYNLKYGILKFIVNDTLIYQRKLHN